MISPKLGALTCILLLALCVNLAAQATNAATQKASPGEGERGTVAYWEKELQGKTKRDIKSALGTPQGIAEQGAVYRYNDEFFHPDLDQWRTLLIRFNSDDLVESFTGEGSDTKTYKIDAAGWQEAADAAGIPAPTPTPSAAPTPDLDALKEEVQASVATIEFSADVSGHAGSSSGATGFIAEKDNKKYLVTNIHVLEGEAGTEIQVAWHHGPKAGEANGPRLAAQARVKSSFEIFQKYMQRIPLPVLKSSGGVNLKSSGTPLLLSQGRDIALLPLETDVQPLEFSTTPPKRGQSVVIVGNPEAGQTLVGLQAKVTNVGPDRFEVSEITGGSIVPGMSGSPVVDAASGQVLGIVSYGIERKQWVGDQAIPSSAGPQVVSWFEVKQQVFAYRLDNLNDFEQTSWPQFVNDCVILTALRERTLNVYWAKNAYDAASDSNVLKELTPDFDNKVQLAYSSFAKDAQRFVKSSDADYRRSRWNEYQRKLETFLRTDLADPKYRIATSYMRRELDGTVANARSYVTKVLRAEAGKIQ